MWDHPNVTQSGGDSLVPSSSLHQTSPLELKHLFFHGDAILRSIPKEVPQRGNFFTQEHPMRCRESQELLASHQL